MWVERQVRQAWLSLIESPCWLDAGVHVPVAYGSLPAVREHIYGYFEGWRSPV
ncbi:MAG TPA: hypothetical protein V6C57_00470 [Coleofasciculaceae cyanobacterium]